MRYNDSELPSTAGVSATIEERLRLENEELRRQLQELRGMPHGAVSAPTSFWRPSRTTIWAICLFVVVIFIIAFLSGYVPLHRRTIVIADEANERAVALPRVQVVTVGRASRESSLQLPGNIQAVTEAPILARADGYLKQRLADIGDHVKAGQTLAIIEAPELDHQVQQAQANLQQAQAAYDQADANLQQGRADLELARVTAKRWGNLVGDGSVSAQENDQYQAQYQAKIAAIHALEKALAVQHSGVAVAEANLARLGQMSGYRTVVAPFDGVITLRNVDTGALVNNGSTLLFRIAQTGTLRIYLNVPQTHAGSVHVGDAATITAANMPGSNFSGTIARTANALDPATRTLLVEVRVPNPTGVLMPGMYAQVELKSSRANPPLLIPSDALIASAAGTQVAVVDREHKVHLRKIVAGRDYGDRLEVMNGVQVGDTIIASPSDVVHEGMEVEPIGFNGRRN